ncbi:hypothetical protein Pmani_019832 [Petrolisthes manimaculis]|uniref:Uncharacterized protein n=1 Tax=Petrolisthes manimaculis TaxID=1843537 RepID=A0AAE1U778_9EUCA|nr:hypothetical protein Pmani_019832 [Petrolisthes manimaculis]
MRVGAVVVTTAVTACWLVVGCESLVILPLTGVGLASKALIAVKGGLIGAVAVLGILKILLKKKNDEEEEENVMYIEPQPVEYKYYLPQQQHYNPPQLQQHYNTPPQLQQHYNPPLPHDQHSSYSDLAFDYAPPPAHYLHHQRKRRSVGNETPGYYNNNKYNSNYNRNSKRSVGNEPPGYYNNNSKYNRNIKRSVGESPIVESLLRASMRLRKANSQGR